MLLRALLPCLLLVRPAFSQPAPVHDDAYWYEDIYSDFFKEEDGALVSRRPRSRPQRFPKKKPEGTLRIFVLGGSVARQYDSEPGPGRPAFSEVIGESLSGVKVETVYCGMGGYDSYRERMVFHEVLGYEPDVIVLMSGNNEAAPYAGPPPSLALKALKFRKALGLGEPERRARPGPRPGYLTSFEENLRDMARSARAGGVRLVLCTLPARLGLSPPSPLPLEKPALFRAWRSMESKDFAGARRLLERCLTRHPYEPHARILLGRCLERLKDSAGALTQYRLVLEQGDGWRLNAVVRKVAAEEGAAAVDLEEAFERVHEDGPLQDEHHWYRSADPWVSAALAKGLLRDPAFLRRVRALGGSADVRKLKEHRPSGLSEEREADFWDRFLMTLWWSSAEGPRFDERVLDLFDELYRESPERVLGLGKMKEELRRRTTGSEWTKRRAAGFERRWAWALAHLGEVLRREGRAREALRFFADSLKGGQEHPVVRLYAAVARASLGEKTQAREGFAALRAWAPCYKEISYYAGELGLQDALRGPSPKKDCPPARSDRRFYLDPVTEKGLTAVMDLFRREEPRAGFVKLDAVLAGSPLGAEAAELFCAARKRVCAPYRKARERIEGLNADGMRRFRDGDLRGAAESFERALEQDPEYPSALMNRGVAAAAAGAYEKAAELFRRAASGRLSPDRMRLDALMMRADALGKLGRGEDARKDLRMVLEEAPPDWERLKEVRRALP